MSAAYVERLNEALVVGAPHALTLDLARFKRARLFAESRLLGLLSAADRRGIKVTLALGGPLTSTGGSSRYWKIFCESVSGLVMGQLATRIVDSGGQDWSLRILDRQAAVLKESAGLIGSGKEVAAAGVDRFGGPAAPGVITSEDALAFGALFRQLLFEHFNLPTLNTALTNILAEFAFEGLQNTRDHAAHDLHGEPISGIRFLSLRRLNLRQERLEDLVGQESSPVSSYLDSLRQELAFAHHRPDQLLELSVADSGVGIAATMAGSMEVYEGDLASERRLLLRALEKDGTSKPSSVAGAGLGLFKIMQATHHLKGLIVFRSGRLQMYRHYLSSHNDWPALDLRDWEGGKVQMIGGTSISLILPWMEANQLNLDLP